MKIAILNGSPKVGNTAAMVNAFAEGANEAGHEVEILLLISHLFSFFA